MLARQNSMPNQFLSNALHIAYSNLGSVSQNPSVGAVIVKNNVIIAEGVTQPLGQDHAEIAAIKKCTPAQLNGATLYVTLEPCCHSNKRTPPCTTKIIESKFKEVIIGIIDKNPNVNGKGIEALRAAGIKTTLLNDKKCEKLHEFFFHWITTQRPFITIKAALTKNGMMMWGNGKNKKITDKIADKKVHELRKQHDAILVGINTIIKDNPQLTNRSGTGKNPIKIILDGNLKTPLDAKIFNEGKTIIYYMKAGKNRIAELSKKCEVVKVSGSNHQVNLNDVLIDLGKRSISSVLVEGGPTTIASFINQRLANKCIFFIAEKEVNGTSFFSLLEKSLSLKDITAHKCGNSIMIEGYL